MFYDVLVVSNGEVESKLRVTTAENQSSSTAVGASVRQGPVQAGISASEASAASHKEVRESDERKIRTVEARLADYKRVVQDEINKAKCDYGIFIIDDFYLINPAYQPEVIDYPHRLLRDTDLYLKVGTVRHRTSLFRPAPLQIGVQENQDVDAFSLDQTLEDIDQTGGYLEEMLRKLGQEVGIDDVPAIVSDEGRKGFGLALRRCAARLPEHLRRRT